MKQCVGSVWAAKALPKRLCAFAAVVGLLAASCIAVQAQQVDANEYAFATPVTVNDTVNSGPVTVSVTVQTAGTVASVEVLTQGVSGADFTQDTTGTPLAGACTARAYAANAVCSVQVVFSPKSPGARVGAVVLKSTSGAAMGTTFLSGTGSGAVQVMVPGVIQTVAGNGGWIFDGDGRQATKSALFLPMGGLIDAAGNMYIADSQNNRVRKVDATFLHNISTVAGNGTAGYSGDGGLATGAALNGPSYLALDGAGNLYISDSGNNVIRRVDGATGKISTVAGTGQAGYAGAFGLAVDALLNNPQGLAVDGQGSVYIADSYNHVVRKLDVEQGVLTTIAGTGNPGFSGDGGSSTQAQLNTPWGIALGLDATLYIADRDNHCIRMVDTGGNIYTVAGQGTQADFTGDGLRATDAKLNGPAAVTLDAAGNLYVADSGNNRVRKVNAKTQIIETIIGVQGNGDTGDGGPANAAGLYAPYGLFLDGQGDLFVSDMFHNSVREVSSNLDTLKYDPIRQGRTSPAQTETIENDGNDGMTLNAINLVSNVVLDPNTQQPCSTSLPMLAGDTCNLGVEFLPTTTGNPVTGQLTVGTTAFNSPGTINLMGQVLATDPTTTALALPNPTPGIFGQPVTFTATVKCSNSVTVLPTGTVQFMDGTAVLGIATVDQASGTATLVTSALAVGSHSITAVYSGDDNNFTSTSGAVTEVIKQASTTVVSSSNPNNLLAGQTVTFTATVAATGTSAATGTVTFKEGTTVLQAATALSGGIVTFTTSALTTANSPHTITAVYSGDTSTNGSSDTLTQTVNLGATTATLVTSNPEVVVGASVTLTATVTSTGVTPTGQVTFMDGTTTLGSPTTVDGVATLDVSTLGVGTHHLTAVYQGDTNNAQSPPSNRVTETIDQIATTTTLGASANPAPAGAQLTLTATVSPAETTGGSLSGGTVTFKEGTTTWGTGTVDGSGVATLTLTTLPVGVHDIVADYGEATNFKASSSTPFSETVIKATTNVVITPIAGPVTAGKPVTFTATVTSDGGTPTGTVRFMDGTTVLGPGTLNNGVASYVANGLPVGPHTITAVYAGDTNDNGNTSPAVSVTVEKATTSVGLISSQLTVVAGKTVTFTATVSGTGGVPTGSVNFMEGTSVLQTVPLTAGVASWSTSGLAPGGHTITAVYSGDANDSANTSAAVLETVQQATTSTTATATPSSVAQGSVVNLTAQVTGNGGTPTGTVQFLEGTTMLGSGTLNLAGVASFSTSVLPFGTHNITAQYMGDTDDAPSLSQAVTVTVLPTTTMSLTANLNPLSAGGTVVFTAGVSGQGSVPTGTVTFMDGGAPIGTTNVNPSGQASLPIVLLPIRTHIITASYSGDKENGASLSQAVSESVVQAMTTTQLSPSAPVSPAGSPVTLTATVAGNGGIPTGTVTFKDGTTVLGPGTLNSQGVATLTTATLTVGTHAITAVYAGDRNDGGSESGTGVSVEVQLATTSVGVSSDTNPSTATVPVTLRALVKGGGDTPAGQVIWKDGVTVIGTTSLDGTGATALPISTLGVGAHNITAAYQGDANSAASVSSVWVQTVTAASSGVTLSSSGSPSLYPDAVVLTATVTAAHGTATGTVTFSDGGTVLGTAAVNGSGTATFSVSTLSIGGHAIVAAYGGDADHSASQSNALTQNVLQRTATGLTPSADPVVASTRLRLTANVVGQNSVSATGTVAFEEGTTVLGTGTLNGAGVATFDISTLPVGQHLIVAVYSGDAKNQTSSSVALSETVISATTQVGLTASANPLTAGSALTLTARVTGSGGALTGTVTFADGSTALGTVPLNAGGVATLTTTTLTPGPHTITATYSGDSTNSVSSSAALDESVLQTTHVALASALNPSLALDPVELTATVTNGGGTPASGTVTFTDGTRVLGSVAMANGAAALTVPSLAVGQHPIVATYGGDAYNFSGSSAALTQTIQLRPTTDTLSLTSSPQGSGQQVTLISVVRWSGAVAPTGSVSFTEGSTQIGTGTVDGTGVASLTVVLSNTAGSVVATYSGDASYAGSTSNQAALPGVQPTKFTMSADANAATVASQQFTVIHLTITSLHGYSDTLKLGCLGLPYAATCTFSNDSVGLPADGKQTVTLTLDTGTPLTSGGQAKVEHGGGGSSAALALLLPGGLMLGLLGWRGRKRLNGLVLLLLLGVGLTVGMTGCSSGLHIHGTPAGSYALKISATAVGSGVTQTMDFNLTVK